MAKFPLLKLLFPYLLGILLCNFSSFEVANRILLFLIFLCFILLITSLFFKRVKFVLWMPMHSSNTIILLFFCLGYYAFQNQKKKSFELLPEGIYTHLLLEITEPIKSSENYRKYFANLVFNSFGDSLVQRRSKVLLNLKKDKNAELTELLPGDRILLKSKIYKLTSAPNPTQFDYSDYLKRKGIYYQTYAEQWSLADSKLSMKRFAYQLRLKLISALEHSAIESNRLEILKAVLLGDKGGLDRELKSSFANAGAMHILAVSGLHVGIVYLLFSHLLNILQLKKKSILCALILLLIIWSFAFISGLSTSVQRSALMFSFILLAEPLKRRNVTLNAVAASALIILLIDPNQLLEASFQLSYSAVLGILLIYQSVYRLVSVKSKILDHIVSLLIVSILAQLATLPFSLLYFHQFPTYFLLSNLIVIPLSFLVVALGLILSILLILSKQALLLDHLLNFTLHFLSESINIINRFPKSSVGPIWLQDTTAILIGLFVICLFFYLKKQKASYLLAALSIIVIALFAEVTASYHSLREKELCIYSLDEGIAISYRNGHKASLISLDSLSAYELEMIYAHMQSEKVDAESIDYRLISRHQDAKKTVLNLDDYRILVSNQITIQDSGKYDLIVLSDLELEEQILKEFKSEEIVLNFHTDQSKHFGHHNLKVSAYIRKF